MQQGKKFLSKPLSLSTLSVVGRLLLVLMQLIHTTVVLEMQDTRIKKLNLESRDGFGTIIDENTDIAITKKLVIQAKFVRQYYTK